MNTRPVILLTLWTLLIGPVMAMPATSGKESRRPALQPLSASEKPAPVREATSYRK